MDKTKIAVDIFNKYANQYQEKFMDMDLYHASFDFFCTHILNDNAAILDIACGPGNITQYLLTQRPRFNILGIDLSPNMIALAKINNPTANFQLMDCRDIGTLTNKFDGLMCGFCLPYLCKEAAVKFIHDTTAILKAGGLLYISTMEDDYSKSGFRKGSTGEEMYMHYHQADYLIEALNNNGFTVIHQQRKEYPAQDGTKTTDLLIIAKL